MRAGRTASDSRERSTFNPSQNLPGKSVSTSTTTSPFSPWGFTTLPMTTRSSGAATRPLVPCAAQAGFAMSFRTVSEAEAPFAIHAFAFSRSSLRSGGFFVGS